MNGSLIEGGARLCSACLRGYEATPEQQALCTLKPVVLTAQLHTCSTRVHSLDHWHLPLRVHACCNSLAETVVWF